MSSMRELVHEADEHLVDDDVGDRLVRLQGHVLQGTLDGVALAGVLLAIGIGHAVLDRNHHLGRGAPGDLRANGGGVELDDRIPLRVGVGAQRAPVRQRLLQLDPLGRIRPALHVGERRLVDADEPRARAGLDRHVAHRHAAFLCSDARDRRDQANSIV
jgi:hypothetical protein